MLADAKLSFIWANFGLFWPLSDDKVGNTFLITVKSCGKSFDGKWQFEAVAMLLRIRDRVSSKAPVSAVVE